MRQSFTARGQAPWQPHEAVSLTTAVWARRTHHAFAGLSSAGTWVCGFLHERRHQDPLASDCQMSIEFFVLAELLDLLGTNQAITIMASPLTEQWLRQWQDGAQNMPHITTFCKLAYDGISVAGRVREYLQVFRNITVKPNDGPSGYRDLADELLKIARTKLPFQRPDGFSKHADLPGYVTYRANAILELRDPALTAQSVTRPLGAI